VGPTNIAGTSKKRKTYFPCRELNPVASHYVHCTVMDAVLSQGVLKMMLVVSTKEGNTVTAAAPYYSSKYY